MRRAPQWTQNKCRAPRAWVGSAHTLAQTLPRSKALCRFWRRMGRNKSGRVWARKRNAPENLRGRVPTIARPKRVATGQSQAGHGAHRVADGEIVTIIVWLDEGDPNRTQN